MGKRKIIVSERDNLAALLEDDLAIEFIIHRGDMLLGDVYLASVENILPSIDAAFVNVGGDKMGFLHSSDVPGKGDLKNRLQPKQQLVVQVMKEPTGHKGPRVTTNISLPGRFLVLMPESKGISISRKIEQASERSRLKSVVSLIKPPGVGVIIRTEADQQKESDIQEDFETLLERWQNIVSTADSATPPTLLYRDQDLLYRVIREAVTDDVRELYVDTNFGQQRAQQLLQNWNMDKNIKVQLYNGNQSILIGMGVDKEIKQALQTKVPLPSGGYLYIQPTEALCVIDVNSGKFTSLQSQADTIRQTNLEATKEIARQLRLRNIGGMIIVDFIDMEARADKLTILEAFENELAPDKSKPQIGQLSDLGLVEMTRHRQGQALSEIFTKRCIACSGTGHALEEFNWAPPMVDGDPRSSGRSGSSRSKLPIRQLRNQQHVPKPAASANAPQPKASVLSLQKAMDPEKPEANKEQKPASGNFQQRNQASKESVPENKPFDEIFKDRIAQKLGIRFANVVKLAHTPPGINSILIRINPKSNDILTLIDTIEGTGFAPMPSGEDEDADESMHAEETPRGHNGGMRRGGHHHPRAAAFDASSEEEERPGARRRIAAAAEQEDSEEPLESPHEDPEVDVISSSEEEEVKPKRTTGRTSVAKRHDLDEDEDEGEVASAAESSDEEDAPEVEEKPKRRRGRPPKRTRSRVTPAADAQEDSDAEEGGEEEEAATPRRGRRPSTVSSTTTQDPPA
jgi:ribonuclease E